MVVCCMVVKVYGFCEEEVCEVDWFSFLWGRRMVNEQPYINHTHCYTNDCPPASQLNLGGMGCAIVVVL